MTPARIQRLAAPLAAVAACLVVLVCADAVLAQQTTMRPPSVQRPESAPILWQGWAAAILALALVVSASLIPSKRGHQD